MEVPPDEQGRTQDLMTNISKSEMSWIEQHDPSWKRNIDQKFQEHFVNKLDRDYKRETEATKNR